MMAIFDKPDHEAGRIAHAVCGAHFLVALSDGDYAKAEEISLAVGLMDKDKPAGIAKSDLEEAAPKIEQSFHRDYDATADRVLELICSLKGNGIAKRAIVQVVRSAVMADRVVKPQEDNASDRIAIALDLKPGEL
jgi:tellurite resistance protein